MGDTAALSELFDAIDRANAADPNVHGGEPLALLQGKAATRWLDRLVDEPAPELQAAVRAHHLERWMVARADYPQDRAGYLRWRRENKAHQADALAQLMHRGGWAPETIDRARVLLSRTKLRSDADTQALEDAACLVFLETQFDDLASRTDRDHFVTIVAKTLKKMSAAAIDLATSMSMSEDAAAIIAEAAERPEAASA